MSALRFPNPIFVALDTPDLGQALAIAKAVGPYVGGLKVGLEFISAQGPQGVAKIIELGRPVFVDVKFHDIPNTVAGAARALARLGAAIFNVHTSGGEAMMRAAVEAARSVDPEVRVLGVTVLTSLDQSVLDEVGQKGPPEAQVERLARLAKASGLHGVVCSAQETGLVRKADGQGLPDRHPGHPPGRGRSGRPAPHYGPPGGHGGRLGHPRHRPAHHRRRRPRRGRPRHRRRPASRGGRLGFTNSVYEFMGRCLISRRAPPISGARWLSWLKSAASPVWKRPTPPRRRARISRAWFSTESRRVTSTRIRAGIARRASERPAAHGGAAGRRERR